MNFITILQFLPLTIFLVYARLNGMTDLAWRDAFILAGVTTLIVVAIQVYKKVTFDRLMLGVNLFLLVGAIGFLGKLYGLLSLYGTYKGAALLICTSLIGIVATLFTKAGFIGVNVIGKAPLKRRYSCFLLIINMIAIVWAIITYQYGLLISAAFPFIVLRFMYENFSKKLMEN